MKNVRIISIFIIIICFLILLYFRFTEQYSIIAQNRIIDNIFQLDYHEDYGDYLGYIYIPRFDIKRLIKSGTDTSILDDGYVGLHEMSDSLYGSHLIILAGHNISSVFSKLHYLSIGDDVFIKNNDINRKFIVYDSIVANEYDMKYFDNRDNELLLITCTDKRGYRLLVFLREVL